MLIRCIIRFSYNLGDQEENEVSLVSKFMVSEIYHITSHHITFIYPRIFRVAYAANISEHLTII